MKQLLEKLNDSFETVSPATLAAIEAVESTFNSKLPTDYKTFLQFTNGLEGEPVSGYLVLWSAEEIIALNQAYNVKEFIPDILIIGSDGAEDAFAFDTTNMSIARLPFIGMGHIANEKISDTFEEFLSARVGKNKSFFKRLFNK